MHRPFPALPSTFYRVEVDARGQRLIIPIRLGWKPVGVATATALFGSLAHGGKLLTDDSTFGWVMRALYALGLIFILLAALTSLYAREVIEIGHGELIHGWRLFGLRRSRRYRVADIFGLTSLAADADAAKAKGKTLSLLSDFGKKGLVRFEVGAKTVHLGPTLTEPEAKEIAAWLAARLPRGATAD